MTGEDPQFLPAALDCIQVLNRFHGDRALRGFQRSLAMTGQFTCISPFSGKPILPIAHYLIPRTGVFYCFGGDVPFALLAGSLKDGYPLVCLVTRAGIFWSGKDRPDDLARQAQSLLTDAPPIRVDQAQKPQVHIGHPNFAHCIWNEFPALLALLDHQPDIACRISFDPLGVLRQSCGKLTVMDDAPIVAGWSKAPVVLPGSTFCNATALETAHQRLGLPLRVPPGDRAPRIWLTIRDSGRTMENQEAFLCTVIQAFHDRDAKTTFLLDGFSSPMDYSSPCYDPMRPSFTERIRAANDIAGRIMARLPGIQIANLTGASLRRAFGEISRCSFYVSHAGTMQHKPAWFYSIPGIIHGNRASLSPGALKWAGQMVKGSIPPAGLSPDIVRDTQVRGLPVHNDRNRDYIVTDLDTAAAQVLAHFDTTRAVNPMIAAG